MRLCDVEAALREVVAGLEPGTLPAEAAAGLSTPPVRSLDPSESEMAAGAVMGAEIDIGSEGAPGSYTLLGPPERM